MRWWKFRKCGVVLAHGHCAECGIGNGGVTHWLNIIRVFSVFHLWLIGSAVYDLK